LFGDFLFFCFLLFSFLLSRCKARVMV
jgi:hypothetical protein